MPRVGIEKKKKKKKPILVPFFEKKLKMGKNQLFQIIRVDNIFYTSKEKSCILNQDF